MKLGRLANKYCWWLVAVVLCCWPLLGGSGAAQPSLTAVPRAETVTMVDVTQKDFYFEDAEHNQGLLATTGVTDYITYLQTQSYDVDTGTSALREVVVAVMDSGLEPRHEVFTDRVLTTYARNYNHCATVTEWNTDLMGHGTHVASIICESTLPNVKILPVRIFTTGEKADAPTWDDMYKATKYIINLKKYKNLNIVACNLSFGTDPLPENSTTHMCHPEENDHVYYDYHYYETMIDNLRAADILPVVATGNAGKEANEVSPGSGIYQYFSWPSGVHGAVAVSAYNPWRTLLNLTGYKLANFSNYGPHVALSAPGVGIWGACSGSFWDVRDGFPRDESVNGLQVALDGTSMATPYVTAAYALLCSDPTRSTAADFDVSWDEAVDTVYPYYYQNFRHKALLLAAVKVTENGVVNPAPDAPNTLTHGYGCVNVSYFAQTAPGEGELANQDPAAVFTVVGTPLATAPRVPKQPVGDQDWSGVFWLVFGGVLVIFAVCAVKEAWQRRRARG